MFVLEQELVFGQEHKSYLGPGSDKRVELGSGLVQEFVLVPMLATRKEWGRHWEHRSFLGQE